MRAINGMKLCNKCGQTKPVAEYDKHKGRADGLQSWCRPCNVRWRCEHLEARRAQQRKWSREHREACRAMERRYIERLGDEAPKRKNAVHAVRRAIKAGRLVRPDRCECCGHVAYTQGHHHSYDKADRLDVTWLCVHCHRLLHARGAKTMA